MLLSIYIYIGARTMQHTPGPWHATPAGFHNQFIIETIDSVGDNSGLVDGLVALTYTRDPDNQAEQFRRAADAQLLAAAPELLAMCQRAHDILDGQDEGLLLMFRDDIGDVIKKATQ